MTTRAHHPPSPVVRSAARALIVLPLLVGGTTACVTENLDTGEMVPRGNQRYPWDKVKELAKDLRKGLTKSQVLLHMGTPAEQDEKGEQWVYLPERYGILIPAEALHLRFQQGVLTEFGYRPIVLGAQL